MDNLSLHKVVGVKVAIESAVVQVVYLPAYSLDLNSIGMVFSKLRALVCKLKLRTMVTL